MDSEYCPVLLGQCYRIHCQCYHDVSNNVPIYDELFCPRLIDTAAALILLPSLQMQQLCR